jgi:hypothetical protein
MANRKSQSEPRQQTALVRFAAAIDETSDHQALIMAAVPMGFGAGQHGADRRRPVASGVRRHRATRSSSIKGGVIQIYVREHCRAGSDTARADETRRAELQRLFRVASAVGHRCKVADRDEGRAEITFPSEDANAREFARGWKSSTVRRDIHACRNNMNSTSEH